MWIPSQVVGWFTSLKNSADNNATVAQDAILYLREELVVVRAERDIFKGQLLVSQTQFDWLRMRVNQLEAERAVLLGKVTGLPMAAPEILRTPHAKPDLAETFSFEDLGDHTAKVLGLEFNH